MRLYEFEGKELLRTYGIKTPRGQLYSEKSLPFNHVVVKAQTLSGGRGKAGLISITSKLSAPYLADEFLKRHHGGEAVSRVLLEEKIDIQKEFYIGIKYDTDSRSALLMLSHHGGININRHEHPLYTLPIFPGEMPVIEEFLRRSGIHEHEKDWETLILDLVKCFFYEDMRLLEINPLALTANGLIAADCKIDLEDEAAFRHKDRTYPARLAEGRAPTERELRVEEMNAKDYRGTIKYMELNGDIGFLAAGGGGSITCMDALIDAGAKPANFTEFSGNPRDEKLYELTKVILSKPLSGLWIVGAIANFTLMDTTMGGVIKALAETKPKFPIVVRRSGPNEKKGMELLQEAKETLGLDMDIYGAEIAMTKTALIIAQKAHDYRRIHGNPHR